MEALDWSPRVTFEAVLDALGALHAPSSAKGKGEKGKRGDAEGSGLMFADVLRTVPFLFRFIALLWTRVQIEADQVERLKESESKWPQAAGAAAGPQTNEGASANGDGAAAAAAAQDAATSAAAAASSLTFANAPNDVANLLRGAF